jgi:hypothetical protein
MMCTSRARGVPAADTGTRMARTIGCKPKDPKTWLTQAACALSRAHGRRELQMHLERDRSDTQDGTPRIRSCPACQTRLQTSHRVVIRHHPRRRRGVRSPGLLSRLSRTGGGITDAAATSSSYYLCNAVPVRSLTQRHALFARCSYDTSYAAPFVVTCTPSLRSAVPAVHPVASIALAVTVPCPSIPAHYSAWYAYERSSKECARASGMTAFAA